MFVKSFKNCREFIAGDNTILREILHPKNDSVDISYSLAHAKVAPGYKSSPHRLKSSTEVYYILKGQGIMHIGEESKSVNEGDAILIPPNSVQYIENTGGEELEFICLVSPAWHKEDEEVFGK